MTHALLWLACGALPILFAALIGFCVGGRISENTRVDIWQAGYAEGRRTSAGNIRVLPRRRDHG